MWGVADVGEVLGPPEERREGNVLDAAGVLEGSLYIALIWLRRVVLPAASRPSSRTEYSGSDVACR